MPPVGGPVWPSTSAAQRRLELPLLAGRSCRHLVGKLSFPTTGQTFPCQLTTYARAKLTGMREEQNMGARQRGRSGAARACRVALRRQPECLLRQVLKTPGKLSKQVHYSQTGASQDSLGSCTAESVEAGATTSLQHARSAGCWGTLPGRCREAPDTPVWSSSYSSTRRYS